MTSNLSPKREVKGALREYGAYPSKKLGQNFIIDNSVIKKFLKVADLKPKDTVLEIGPGPGNLTQEIAGSVKRVIAVEKDPRMCEILKESLKDFGNVEIIQGDILKVGVQNPKSEVRNPKQILNSKFQIPKTYKVMGNLPFYLTSPVIRKFLEDRNPPEEMVLFVQKEVAQRICSRPPKMNLLAVSVQFYAKPEIAGYVSKKSFWPQPKVDSAIIKITPRKPLMNPGLVDLFFEIVRAGFSHPRKQLANNLTKNLKLNTRAVAKGKEENLFSSTRDKVIIWLEKNKIQPSQRAETLEIKDWVRLTQSFTRARRSRAKGGDEGKL